MAVRRALTDRPISVAAKLLLGNSCSYVLPFPTGTIRLYGYISSLDSRQFCRTCGAADLTGGTRSSGAPFSSVFRSSKVSYYAKRILVQVHTTLLPQCTKLSTMQVFH